MRTGSGQRRRRYWREQTLNQLVRLKPARATRPASGGNVCRPRERRRRRHRHRQFVRETQVRTFSSCASRRGSARRTPQTRVGVRVVLFWEEDVAKGAPKARRQSRSRLFHTLNINSRETSPETSVVNTFHVSIEIRIVDKNLSMEIVHEISCGLFRIEQQRTAHPRGTKSISSPDWRRQQR